MTHEKDQAGKFPAKRPGETAEEWQKRAQGLPEAVELTEKGKAALESIHTAQMSANMAGTKALVARQLKEAKEELAKLEGPYQEAAERVFRLEAAQHALEKLYQHPPAISGLVRFERKTD